MATKNKAAKTTKAATSISSIATVSKEKQVINPATAAAPAPVIPVAQEAKEKNKESLLSNLKPESNHFINHASGTKVRESIYRPGIIPENKKGSARKTIRKALDAFAEAAEFYNEQKDTAKLKLLKADFNKYYSKVFKTNDYTVESILGGNTKDGRKEQISSLLKTLKSI